MIQAFRNYVNETPLAEDFKKWRLATSIFTSLGGHFKKNANIPVAAKGTQDVQHESNLRSWSQAIPLENGKYKIIDFTQDRHLGGASDPMPHGMVSGYCDTKQEAAEFLKRREEKYRHNNLARSSNQFLPRTRHFSEVFRDNDPKHKSAWKSSILTLTQS